MTARKNIIQVGDVLPTKDQPKRLPCNLDLDRFLVTRALVQAESGGGKSWLLRRMAEQCYSFLPPIIIDPEGEFASLREKDDYIICAPSGADAVANVQTASLLAHKILETGVAAVIDIFEMSPGEQRLFVQRFFDALTNAPKNLWNPRLVILDEVQMFASEGDKGPCSVAVQNASTRWRKRGFVLVGATQRIANVSKDVTAGLKNKFIGGTSQDIDVARAARELGMRDIHAATDTLRRLEPGEFYCYGPALSHDVRKIAVGPVETSHPESGKKRLKAPPPPSKKIKELLAGLADLPKEAEAEARTAEELKGLLKQRDTRIRELEKAQPAPAPAPKTVEVPVITEAQIKRLEKVAQKFTDAVNTHRESAQNTLLEVSGAVTAIVNVTKFQQAPQPQRQSVVLPTPTPSRDRPPASPPPAPRPAGDDTLNGPEQRIVDAIAWLNGIGVDLADQSAVAFLANYSVTSTSYTNPRATLNVKGLVQLLGKNIALTPAGRKLANPVQGLDSNEDVHRHVLAKLPGPEQRLLKPLLEAFPKALSNEVLAAAASYSHTSTSYTNPRARLNVLGLTEYVGGEMRARDILFPFGKR